MEDRLKQPFILNHLTYREARGEIFSFYHDKEFKERFPDVNLVQDRMSISYRGTVRGFHGDPETWKYITCPLGKFHLVTVNLKDKRIYEFFLSEEDKQSVLIPPYFLNAHQCLSHMCIFSYKQSTYYEDYPAEKQWTVKYDDRDISPNWTLDPLRVSERDKNGKSLRKLVDELGL